MLKGCCDGVVLRGNPFFVYLWVQQPCNCQISSTVVAETKKIVYLCNDIIATAIDSNSTQQTNTIVMRRFFVFAMLILGMVACDKDRTHEQINVGVGGEIEAKVCVEIPESVTRAGGGSDKGVFENGILDENTTMRYILEIFNKDVASHPANRMTVFTNEMSADFDVRLAPDRNYIFVVWADVVKKETTAEEFSDNDNHYDTSDLHAVKVIETNWNAMDESRDAFTGTKTVENYNSTSVIKLTLRRPNAKLRVLTKDMSSATAPNTAAFTYTCPIYTAYNAVTGNVVKGDDAPNTTKTHNISYSNVYNETGNEYTLFSDYFFADDKVDETITFTLEVQDSNNTSIANISLNSGCKVKSTWLTTIAGNLLTSGNSSNQSAEF